MGLTNFPGGTKFRKEHPKGGHHAKRAAHLYVRTKEFKLEAVQLVQRSGKPQAQIARDPGIADSTLHHWCKECAQQGSQAFPGSGHQTAQEASFGDGLVRRSPPREMLLPSDHRAVPTLAPDTWPGWQSWALR